MSELQGIPFVPGVARGILRRGHAASPDNILVLTQQEPGLSESRPDGTTLSGATVLARQVCAAADSQQVRELLALPLAGNQP